MSPITIPVLLIAISTASSAVVPPQGVFSVLSPFSAVSEAVKNPENLPGKWKTVFPLFPIPRVEIHLTKDSVSPNEDKTSTNEPKRTEESHGATTDMRLTAEQKKALGLDGGYSEQNYAPNVVTPDDTVPYVGSRYIITAPDRTGCPSGQRKNDQGQCRDVL